jgi:hypothetical protein
MSRSLLALLVLATPPAFAAGVTVTGVVNPPARVENPATEHVGFVSPIENPILPVRVFDPRPECFVYLEVKDPPADATAPQRVLWELGSTFRPLLLPVVDGSTVEITNGSRDSHALHSPDRPDLIPKDVFGPKSSRTMTVSSQGKPAAIRVLSQVSPHVSGRVVAVPTRYHARVERDGRFRIENVPPGKWIVRVWFRDGWLERSWQVEVPTRNEVRLDLDNLTPAK